MLRAGGRRGRPGRQRGWAVVAGAAHDHADGITLTFSLAGPSLTGNGSPEHCVPAGLPTADVTNSAFKARADDYDAKRRILFMHGDSQEGIQTGSSAATTMSRHSRKDARLAKDRRDAAGGWPFSRLPGILGSLATLDRSMLPRLLRGGGITEGSPSFSSVGRPPGRRPTPSKLPKERRPSDSGLNVLQQSGKHSARVPMKVPSISTTT